MSERIYACLLRLFPSGFRRHYKEESLQLVRDRLRDEKGLIRRLRLIFDLIVDIARALPQAYRNSYAEAAPAALLASRLDGVPSFGGLPEEPIRRGTILLAGVLVLTTVLAVFTYVVEPSTPYHPDARVGRISPIEAVLEHLNGPISPVSEGSVHSDAPLPSSADTRQVMSGSTPAAKGPLSPGPIPPVSETQSGLRSPVASYSERRSSDTVAGSSALAPAVPVVVQNSPATIGNFTGRWTSSLESVRGVADIPQDFVFVQDSGTLTGTAGENSAHQYPMIHGLVEGDSVRFEVNIGPGKFIYDLTVEDKELRGTLFMRSESETRTVKVWLERAR